MYFITKIYKFINIDINILLFTVMYAGVKYTYLGIGYNRSLSVMHFWLQQCMFGNVYADISLKKDH